MERSLIPSEFKKLSVAERILMVEEIWDSIAAEQESMEVTAAQRSELDRRLAFHSISPDEGRTWEDIKGKLKADP